ncbi:MAG: hypothetical protein H5T69_14425, partial [Chloroflexi bacterium]|nr:hypothetical protein [Chloroflexota bacterium]
SRTLVWLVVILALLLWGGLVLFLNRRPPTAANQALFLFLWGAAVGCGTIPFYYALGSRGPGWITDTERLGRAVRRGTLTGILALALMALRLLRLLTLIPAVLLTLLTLTVEVSLSLRRR